MFGPVPLQLLRLDRRRRLRGLRAGDPDPAGLLPGGRARARSCTSSPTSGSATRSARTGGPTSGSTRAGPPTPRGSGRRTRARTTAQESFDDGHGPARRLRLLGRGARRPRPDSGCSRARSTTAVPATLHALRQKIGDEAFLAGSRTWVSRFDDGTASTDDFQAVFEEASGAGPGASSSTSGCAPRRSRRAGRRAGLTSRGGSRRGRRPGRLNARHQGTDGGRRPARPLRRTPRPKIRAWFSGAMPMPVSRTTNSTLPAVPDNCARHARHHVAARPDQR